MSAAVPAASVPRPNATPAPAPDRAEVTQEEAAAMLRAAFNLFARWQLDGAQSRRLLGSPSERTFQRWKSGEIAAIPHDTIFRLGNLMGIHKALRYMFTEPQRGYEWIRKPNDAFGGHSALDRMLQGAPTDLSALRAYLDAERAGW
jgi:antitoxin Xre/MbcA/ParS-like protein